MTLAGIGRDAFPLAAAPRRDGQSSNLSPAALGLAHRLVGDLGELVELSKHDSAAADQLVGSLVSHLRCARPSVAAVTDLTRAALVGDQLDPIERDAIYAVSVADPERGGR